MTGTKLWGKCLDTDTPKMLAADCWWFGTSWWYEDKGCPHPLAPPPSTRALRQGFYLPGLATLTPKCNGCYSRRQGNLCYSRRV